MKWLVEAVASALIVALLPTVDSASQATTQTMAVTTTTEESMVGRGSKKFGDGCTSTKECGFRGSVCDSTTKLCQCHPDLLATNHLDKCGKPVPVNESCFFNEQCETAVFLTECRDGRCVCRFDKTPVINKEGNYECQNSPTPTESPHHVDPAMIGILAGMGLMFIIICVVLRLFSKARWRENRTIFNTPNPRLMNVSLLQHNKNLHDGRRGSKSSVRGPSRAASVTSLRPHSPSASQGSKNGISRCNSRTSNHSPNKELKSPTKVVEENNISTLESVTVESQPLNQKA